MDEEATQDLFAALGKVRTRRMFGGLGIYAGETMFAIAVGGEIFLKADAETARRFEAAGSRIFTYRRDGRTATMNYWRLPDDGLDDPDRAAAWGRLALEVARQARSMPSKRRKAAVEAA